MPAPYYACGVQQVKQGGEISRSICILGDFAETARLKIDKKQYVFMVPSGIMNYTG
jgi:hypothetical protein